MKRFLPVPFLLFSASPVVCAPPADGAKPAPRPNVVLILADDLGYGDLGCYGATKVRTPRIDSLADEGMRFTDAHSAGALCCPSRYGLMTGAAPWRKSRRVWATAASGLLFPVRQTTLGSVMESAGYTGAAIGKWHLGLGKPRPDYLGRIAPGPLELGFDTCLIDPDNHHGFYVKDHGILGADAKDPVTFGTGLAPTGGTYTKFDPANNGNLFAGAAEEFIASAEKPFFLYFAPNEIHSPHHPTKPVRGTSEAGIYGEVVHDLDLLVGRILDAVKAKGAWENTIVLFTSDNGGVMTRDSLKAGHRANGILQGQKSDIWEGGHSVPLLVRWPGRVAPGSECPYFVCLTDVLATLAGLTGETVDAASCPDSLSFLPLLDGKAPDAARAERSLILISGGSFPGLGVRQGSWMFLRGQGPGGVSASGTLKPGGSGYAPYAEAGFTNDSLDASGQSLPRAPADQLYDLASDPGQTRNLVETHPGIAARLRSVLDASVPPERERQ